MRIAAMIVCFTLAGCAAMPDKLRLVASHTSHVSQHFGSDHTDFGYEAVAIELGWKRGPWFADVSDGMILNTRDTNVHGALAYGGMLGPREIFQARTGVEIDLR